jgi:hypothetical protein
MRLAADHENLRTALAWAIGKPSSEQIVSLAGTLGSFWYLRSRFLSAARDRLTEVEFASAWDAGCKMGVEEAIAYVLRELQ